jgi:ABC-2 type transport system permease protein
MTAAESWTELVARADGESTEPGRPGALAVWLGELGKLAGQLRVRVAVGVCAIAPFLVAGAFKIQSAVPQDTLFGQYVHSSGFALPLVILGFVGQWVLPLLISIVAGDIFSSEDRYGTWKMLLSRSCSRGQLFVGKFAAALTYSIVVLVLLVSASVCAGLLLGTQPLVGLSGQIETGGHAEALILASWATQLPPLFAVCGFAILLSIVSRNSVVGIGGPVLLSLIVQLATLINMPEILRATFLTTPFDAWHGLWTQPTFYRPIRQGMVTSAVWFVDSAVIAWAVFVRRDVTVS